MLCLILFRKSVGARCRDECNLVATLEEFRKNMIRVAFKWVSDTVKPQRNRPNREPHRRHYFRSVPKRLLQIVNVLMLI